MAFSGRALTIDLDTTTLVGVRTKGLSITNEYVDVTTDDDDGWRKLLTDPSLRACEVTVSGISDDEVLLAAIMEASKSNDAISINLPSSLANPGTVAGNFLISALETTANYDGSMEFSATFMSTGEFTYTASAA